MVSFRGDSAVRLWSRPLDSAVLIFDRGFSCGLSNPGRVMVIKTAAG